MISNKRTLIEVIIFVNEFLHDDFYELIDPWKNSAYFDMQEQLVELQDIDLLRL